MLQDFDFNKIRQKGFLLLFGWNTEWLITMRKCFLSRYIHLFSGHNKQIMHLHSRCTIIFINDHHIVYGMRESINSVRVGEVLRASW